MKKDDLRDYFLTNTPSEEQKERMLAGVLERYETQKRAGSVADGVYCAEKGNRTMNVNMKKRLSTVAVIAAVMALTTVSAFAAVPELRSWISEQFGISAEQEQQLSASGALQNIDAAASNDKLTMTVRQMLADENGMYIVYDVDSADGSAVKPDDDDFRFSAPENGDVFMYAYEQQVLEEREDGVTCMAVLSGLEDLSGQKVSLTSCGLTAEWTVGEVAQLRSYDAELSGTDVWTGKGYHVTGYGLSPICVKLNLEILDDLKNDGMPDTVTVDVQQADGSVRTYESGSSSGKEMNGQRYQMFYFDEIIDVDAVTAVYVDGVKLG